MQNGSLFKHFLIYCLFFGLMACKSGKITPPSSIESANIEHVTDETFEYEVIRSDKLVVVDFWATWCGPCKDIDKMVRDLSNDFSTDEVKFVKLDADENQISISSHEVFALPTVLFFKNGEEVHRQTGLTTCEHLRHKIQQFK